MKLVMLLEHADQPGDFNLHSRYLQACACYK